MHFVYLIEFPIKSKNRMFSIPETNKNKNTVSQSKRILLYSNDTLPKPTIPIVHDEISTMQVETPYISIPHCSLQISSELVLSMSFP